MKKLTKILVLLLSLALLCTVALIAVSAAEATELDISAAEGSAAGGKKLVLDGNVKVSSTIEITESLTIDLAGHSLTSTADVAFKVTGNVDFAIVGDGTITVDGGLVTTDSANVKVAGIKGLKINQTNVKGNIPLAYTGAGKHFFTNIDVVSAASATDIFSIGGNSSNTFAAMTLSSSAGTLKDDSGLAASSVINMRDGGLSLTISHSTIDVSAINAIKVAENRLRYNDFIKIKNSSVTVANASAENGSGARPAFLAGAVPVASDIVIEDSYISYSNRIQLNGNTNGSAVIFDNTDIYNSGTGEPFFENINVKVINGSSMSGSPSSSYAENAPLFGSYNNSGSMTVGKYDKVNLILETGTRFDEATKNKILGEGKFYTKGQVVYDNGTLPTDPISGEEDAELPYKFTNESIGYKNIPYLLVPFDAKMFDEGVIHYKDEAPSYLIWGSNAAGDVHASTTVGDNTYWRYVKGGDTSAPCYVYTTTEFSKFNYDTLVFDVEFSADGDAPFAGSEISLSARTASSDNRVTSYIRLNSNGTVTTNSGTFTMVAENVKINASGWNHLSIVLDKTTDTGIVYIYLNGQYLGSGKAYNAGTVQIFGLRFDVFASNPVGSALLIDNPTVRGYSSKVSGSAADIAENYLYAGGAVWNESSSESKPAIVAGGRTIETLSEALELNRTTGAYASLNEDVASSEIITESGKIYTNGFAVSAAPGSIPFNTDSSGICDFNEIYDVSLDFKYYTGTFRDEAGMANEANFTDAVNIKIGTSYNDAYAGPAIGNVKALFDNHYKEASLIGWSIDPKATEPDAPFNFDFAAEHQGEVIKLYPVFDGENGTRLYDILLIKADGTVDETRCVKVGGDGVIWGSHCTALNVKYGETIVFQRDLRIMNHLERAWPKVSDTDNASNAINIDINGHYLKVDTNADQTGSKGKVEFLIPVLANQTVNVYSTHEGGRISCFGGAETYYSGGCIFRIDGAGSTLNVGEFTKADGTVIPGSNLLLEASKIVDMTNATSTSSLNINGPTISVNAVDTGYAGVFTVRGNVNIENSMIVSPFANGIGLISTLSDEEGAISFDNCTIITGTNGGSLFGAINGMKSVKFTNCVTNGAFTLPDGASSSFKVLIGDGNVYSESAVSILDEGAVETEWNGPTVFTNGKTSITVNYFKTKENNDWTAKTDDYDYFTYEVTVGASSGTNVLGIPATMAYRTLGAEDFATLTYVLADGSVITETYLKGTAVNPAPAIPNVSLNVIEFVFTGKFDVEIPEIIEEDLVVTPVYEKTVNITGIRINVSIYSDYALNIYIPAEYEDYITSITEGDKTYTALADTVEGAPCLKVTVYREAYEATKDAVLTIGLQDGQYTAAKEVTVNVASYAKKVIDSSDASITDADKALMKYMLKYSQEAIKYLGRPEDAVISEILADASLSDYDYASKAVVDTSTLANVFSDVTVDIASGDLAFIFVVKDGFAGKFTIDIGTRTFTEADIKNGQIKLGGMKVYNLAPDIIINAESEGGNELISNGKYNLATFVNAHANGVAGEASENCLPLLKAFYNFVMNANEHQSK